MTATEKRLGEVKKLVEEYIKPASVKRAGGDVELLRDIGDRAPRLLELERTTVGYATYGDPLSSGYNANRYGFWPKHKHEFPILYLLAIIILGGQATSIECERVHSLAGRIVTKLRAALLPAKFELLTLGNIFLKEMIKKDEELQALIQTGDAAEVEFYLKRIEDGAAEFDAVAAEFKEPPPKVAPRAYGAGAAAAVAAAAREDEAGSGGGGGGGGGDAPSAAAAMPLALTRARARARMPRLWTTSQQPGSFVGMRRGIQ